MACFRFLQTAHILTDPAFPYLPLLSVARGGWLPADLFAEVRHRLGVITDERGRKRPLVCTEARADGTCVIKVGASELMWDERAYDVVHMLVEFFSRRDLPVRFLLPAPKGSERTAPISCALSMALVKEHDTYRIMGVMFERAYVQQCADLLRLSGGSVATMRTLIEEELIPLGLATPHAWGTDAGSQFFADLSKAYGFPIAEPRIEIPPPAPAPAPAPSSSSDIGARLDELLHECGDRAREARNDLLEPVLEEHFETGRVDRAKHTPTSKNEAVAVGEDKQRPSPIWDEEGALEHLINIFFDQGYIDRPLYHSALLAKFDTWRAIVMKDVVVEKQEKQEKKKKKLMPEEEAIVMSKEWKDFLPLFPIDVKDKRCARCAWERVVTRATPCGHTGYCARCYELAIGTLWENNCRVCQQGIGQVVHEIVEDYDAEWLVLRATYGRPY